jgi:uncharacterized protein YecE (DUF72 family)
MRQVWIGTSGWVYKEWAGHFYPKGWPKKDEFSYYTRHFPTVEINATFYRLPTLKMVRGWRERSPEGFLFAVKGSRYLTHIRRLRDTSKGLKKYFSRLKPLEDRCGPILWQLPPNFTRTDENVKRLDRFLAKLPRNYRHAVEFRHPSWFAEATFDLLRRHRAANVWISSLRMPQDYTVTGDFVYLRFHGLKGGAYHDYTAAELRPWARQLAQAAQRGIPAYVYFNNDLNTRAPLNAEALLRMLGKHAVRSFTLTQRSGIGPIKAPVIKPEVWPETWVRRRRSTTKAPSRNTAKATRESRRRPGAVSLSKRRIPPMPVAAAAIYSAPRHPLGR